jgi:hypothetical protein
MAVDLNGVLRAKHFTANFTLDDVTDQVVPTATASGPVRTWQYMSARVVNVAYTNTTGSEVDLMVIARPIDINSFNVLDDQALLRELASGIARLVINGATSSEVGGWVGLLNGSGSTYVTITGTIPNGATYLVEAANAAQWMELRA